MGLSASVFAALLNRQTGYRSLSALIPFDLEPERRREAKLFNYPRKKSSYPSFDIKNLTSIPPPLLPDKDKPLDSDEDSLGVNAGGPGEVGGAPGSGSLRHNSQSAFLGPLLWERTLPCDGGLFQLQYMDLEEFLTENGMGMHSNGPSSTSAQIPSQVRPTGSANVTQTSFTCKKKRR